MENKEQDNNSFTVLYALPHLKMYLYPLSSSLPSCRIGKMFLFLPEVSRSMCVLITTCSFVDLALLHFLYYETLVSFSCFPSIWMWTSLFSKPNQSEHLPPPIYTHCFECSVSYLYFNIFIINTFYTVKSLFSRFVQSKE